VASHAAARTATREVRTPTARPYGVARAVAAAPVPLPGAGFVGPHPKTATVERRERSRSPRDRVVALRRRDRKNECACRRSIHPSFGVDANNKTRRGRRRAPRDWELLFED